jgi:hypothetical protein
VRGAALRALVAAYDRAGPPLAEVVARHPRVGTALRRHLFAPAAARAARREAAWNGPR